MSIFTSCSIFLNKLQLSQEPKMLRSNSMMLLSATEQRRKSIERQGLNRATDVAFRQGGSSSFARDKSILH